ncbi:hypothetical protein F441_10786 [Phytophthora nicotianae CJ01A1]|uniref:Uncharacterized protein n=3 Tax=Phytophthora nicotianae TaxID=4792 RepID=V9F035_PHYNI|nr:hypothetical protein F443_10861 [Phytophthora nicotianae P1569]ETK84440.1 hypothetical protein L915_10596 [Phytophthora nicotianae]ETP14265.1 hypothetical protein F441_10786 [Phytophthora nicotianae CJ01A1]ETL37878.1 hypothetical protein L916_10488 [Phytophthora nicotianae]ETL91003.1 hypothetical protein L917_10412 [Phytophthora nicotianae]
MLPYLSQVRARIVKGQREGRYQEDLLDQWINVFISPIGVVEKAGLATAIQIINYNPLRKEH